jgi:hypothetical protein
VTRRKIQRALYRLELALAPVKVLERPDRLTDVQQLSDFCPKLFLTQLPIAMS